MTDASTGFSLSNPAIIFGIFNLAAYVVTIAIAFTKLGGRMDVMSSRLKSVEDDLRELATTDRRLSVIEERQTNHARMRSSDAPPIATPSIGHAVRRASQLALGGFGLLIDRTSLRYWLR